MSVEMAGLGLSVRVPEIVGKVSASALPKGFLATWRVDQAPPIFLENLSVANQEWAILQDRTYSGEVFLPSVYLRVQYDPAALPAEFPLAKASLYRQDGTGWTAAPSTLNAQTNTFETSAPVGLSAWTFAAKKGADPDQNGDGNVDIKDLPILIERIVSHNVEADLTGDGTEDGLDLLEMANYWEGSK